MSDLSSQLQEDLGKVIKLAQAKADGRADGKTLSQAVMQRLS